MTTAYSSEQRRYTSKTTGREQSNNIRPVQPGLSPPQPSPGNRGVVYPPQSPPLYLVHANANGPVGQRSSTKLSPDAQYLSVPEDYPHAKPSRNNHQRQRSSSSHPTNHHRQRSSSSNNKRVTMSSDVNSKGTSANLVKRNLIVDGKVDPKMQSVELHHRPLVKPRHSGHVKDPESELITSFDPMKDRHMWTMWRTAVTGHIVDEAMRLEQLKNENGIAAVGEETGIYGKSLVAPPLRKFIKFGEGSKEIAQNLMSQGQGRLLASQFVFYGLPRVYVSKQPPSKPDARQNE